MSEGTPPQREIPKLHEPFKELEQRGTWKNLIVYTGSRNIKETKYDLEQNGPFLFFYSLERDPLHVRFFIYIINYSPNIEIYNGKIALKLSHLQKLEVIHYIVFPTENEMFAFQELFMQRMKETHDYLSTFDFRKCAVAEQTFSYLSTNERMSESVTGLMQMGKYKLVLQSHIKTKASMETGISFDLGSNCCVTSVLETPRAFGSDPLFSCIFLVEDLKAHKFAYFICTEVEYAMHWIICISKWNDEATRLSIEKKNSGFVEKRAHLAEKPKKQNLGGFLKKANDILKIIPFNKNETPKKPQKINQSKPMGIPLGKSNSAMKLLTPEMNSKENLLRKDSSESANDTNSLTRSADLLPVGSSSDTEGHKEEAKKVEKPIVMKHEVIKPKKLGGMMKIVTHSPLTKKTPPPKEEEKNETNSIIQPQNSIQTSPISKDQPLKPPQIDNLRTPSGRSSRQSISHRTSLLSIESNAVNKSSSIKFNHGESLAKVLEKELESLKTQPKRALFKPPSASDYESLNSIKVGSLEELMEGVVASAASTDTTMLSGLIEVENVSNDDIFRSTIMNLEGPDDASMDFVPFDEFPSFERDQLESPTQQASIFLESLSELSQRLIGNTQTMTNGGDVDQLVFFISALFLNGLKEFSAEGKKADIRTVLDELAEAIPVARSAADSASSFPRVYKQISVFVEVLLNESRVVPLLHEVAACDEWVGSHYEATAMMRSYRAFDNTVQVIHSIVRGARFDLEPRDVFGEASDEAISTALLLPLNYQLECRRLLDTQKEDVAVEVAARMLDAGLIRHNAWAFLQAVAKAAPAEGAARELADAVNGTRMAISTQTMVEAVLREGIRARRLHVWLAVMALSTQQTEKFYYPAGSMRDLHRTRYILLMFAEAMRRLGQAT